MSNEVNQSTRKLPRLSLDTWAVVLGLVLAALVRLGVLKHVSW